MKLLWLILLIPSYVISGELALIEQLDADDYEVREQASNKLELLSEDNIQWLIDEHMKNLKKPEVATRLIVAAQKIFIKTALLRTVEYRSFMAYSGVSSIPVYEKKENEQPGIGPAEIVFPRNVEQNGMDKVINAGEGTDFKEGDLVEFVWKDEAWIKPPKIQLLAGDVVKFQVRRYTEPEKAFLTDGPEEGFFAPAMVLDTDNKNYKIIEIELKVGWKPKPNIEEKEAIISRQWIIFLAKATAKKE